MWDKGLHVQEPPVVDDHRRSPRRERNTEERILELPLELHERALKVLELVTALALGIPTPCVQQQRRNFGREVDVVALGRELLYKVLAARGLAAQRATCEHHREDEIRACAGEACAGPASLGQREIERVRRVVLLLLFEDALLEAQRPLNKKVPQSKPGKDR
eukprot:Amastigsp_a842011_62.p2 type:complete len:162 gc:universal Amastigsp_a842011_62:483-968(+)